MTVASGANFLVLDEPTNHLDLESREALEAALEAFPGTVLLVSHDRALLDAVAERTLAIEDGELHAYDGGWAELLRRREERAARATPAPQPRSRSRSRSPRPAPKQRRPTELERIEAEIAAREAEVARARAKLADGLDGRRRRSPRTSARRDALQALLERWEQLFEAGAGEADEPRLEAPSDASCSAPASTQRAKSLKAGRAPLRLAVARLERRSSRSRRARVLGVALETMRAESGARARSSTSARTRRPTLACASG